ncbi:hypothetical protein PV10_06528 [Exophiala mesophila]|uniref:Ankyrin repeat protein n=1 Tax=Exophiala mesophila TaxID=212818 RepID=A0A0D1WSC6_EXOME|nr:uncharacterized protein PV10_06528 [Exophiala mesophila]KIV92055.1 hypothetical protein PV10_06528 [Exophiala mesophila]
MAVKLPKLPVPISEFVEYIHKNFKSHNAVTEAVTPFIDYENKLREVYAQYPDHPAASENHMVPIFNGPQIMTKARDVKNESPSEKNRYLLPLSDGLRRKDNAPATVDSLRTFRTNFNIFSESSLADLDWSNVVVAGSAVNTSLLPVDAPHNESKRALRHYYHDVLAPASDVDLFLYGLTEEQAIEKIKQIESKIRDSILSETTTVRTKNAITIVSQYPTRHVQIVLRLYKSISEILTGFDVDCSCVAYDGQQVWASPRAVASFMTQVNTIDLTRRSPSYENRLSKYSHRGFEAYWPLLQRDRVDPTIFERSFGRVQGLARLLVLEKLPLPSDREQYLAKRREERGRPALHWSQRNVHQLPGNLKDRQPDDVAEWVEEDDISNYHTVTIPYGPTYTAKRIEKLLFSKDLLLNAEWNKPKDRETVLHRHPTFFGSMNDVIHDCCGFCPKPTTDADLAAFEEESKVFISGPMTFLTDNPGRQAIGSFNPITDVDWTEMAYVGNTTRLCQAIVDQDLEAVRDWFSSTEVVDVDRRDHTGRTPLHLATMCSTPEIVHTLIEHGARIVSRLYNGMTALHIAAHRGEFQMVKYLLDKSASNEEEESRKEDGRKIARRTASKNPETTKDVLTVDDVASAGAASNIPIDDVSDSGNEDWEDEEDSDHHNSDGDSEEDAVTEGSFVKVGRGTDTTDALLEGKDEPDVYNVDVLAWDSPMSPLHLAILAGKVEVVELLIDNYSADVLLPVKIMDDYDRKSAKAAILTIVLALELPLQEANQTVKALLARGATPTQADMNCVSALHYAINSTKTLIIDTLQASDPAAVAKACNFVAAWGYSSSPTVQAPILTAIRSGRMDLAERLISLGAKMEIDFSAFVEAYKRGVRYPSSVESEVLRTFQRNVEQPIILAAKMEMIDLVNQAIDAGVDVNTISAAGWKAIEYSYGQTNHDYSLLDIIRARIKVIQDSIEPKTELKKPEELGKPAEYLKAAKGTYSYWTAYHDFNDARAVKKFQLESYQKKLDSLVTPPTDGSVQREAALEQTLLKLNDLEKKLVRKKAKTFKELHPNARLSEPRGFHFAGYKSSPYATNIGVGIPGLTPDKREDFTKLFEACWKGDSETVRSLCLSPTRPLQIATVDLRGFCPFSIAAIRGHFDLARLIVEIATVQYHPTHNMEKYKYTLRVADDEYDSDDSYDSDESQTSDFGVLRHLVKDDFTVDNVAALSDTVKSIIPPAAMINWSCQVTRALDDKVDRRTAREYFSHPTTLQAYVGKNPDESWEWFNAAYDHNSRSSRDNLVRYAIFTNNMRLLKFMIKTGNELAALKEDDGHTLKVFNISTADFELAIRLGRLEMIGEILKSTGFGFPLRKIFLQSGVKLEQKSQYYQGLTVHGRKREDWAEAGRRGHRSSQKTGSIGVPLLGSVLMGNLESVEYFLSDAPMRRYLEFEKTFEDDKHLRALKQSPGGFEGKLTEWLSTRNHLALHVGVLSAPNEDGLQPVFDYLLEKTPHGIENRSADGKTPLQLAFEVGRYQAARKLIAAGANQATKDNAGRNILHSILETCGTKEDRLLESLFALLEPKLVPTLLLERCSGSDFEAMTPLALFLNRCNKGTKDWQKTVEVILQYSGGKDLEKLNGAGDYPLHVAVRANNVELVEFLVEYRPGLLHWENGTGMTPIDVASTAYLRSFIENPPQLSEREQWSVKDTTAKDFVNVTDISVPTAGASYPAVDTTAEWKMQHLIVSLQQKYPAKRKLVSLYDANEVAKRLALIQQTKKDEEQRREELRNQAGNNGIAAQDVDADEKTKDEVEQYLATARGFRQWDQVKWREEVLNEATDAARKAVLGENEMKAIAGKAWWNVPPFSEIAMADASEDTSAGMSLSSVLMNVLSSGQGRN